MKVSHIFRDESKLMPEYVPDSLPYREKQLKQLITIYRGFIEAPGSAFYRAIAYGPVGTGKTAVSKKFGSMLKRRAERRGLDVKYIHVNCYRDRTLFMVAKRIARGIYSKFPERGYSAQEYLEMAWGYLEDKEAYAFIVIDEFDYIARTNPDAIYMLTRLSDPLLQAEQRMSILFVVRDISFLYMLDQAFVSTLQHNIVEFKPYTSKQLAKILEQRVEEAFRPGVVNSEVINFIASLAGVDGEGNGDARYALELLWRAGKYAELDESDEVKPEHVRKATHDIHPGVRVEELENLTNHELLLLLSLAAVLRSTGAAFVKLSKVEEAYRSICESLGLKPRMHTQIWEYVQRLKRMGFISSRVNSLGRGRGRSTFLGLSGIPASMLEAKIRRILGGRLG